MATKILMPKLSDTMTEGVILRWVKKEGEKVKQGEILVEIQSDKADMELEAYDSGVLKKILIPEGGRAEIGELIAIIGGENEDISSIITTKPKVESKPQEAVKKVADLTRQEEKVITPKTPEPAKLVEAAKPTQVTKGDGRVKASPLARRIAQEHHVDLGALSGTGPGGRIIKRDLEEVIAKGAPVAPAVARPGIAFQEFEVSQMRKVVARRMLESKTTAPHFYVTSEIDMKKAIEFRTAINALEEVKISYNDMIIKACAKALLKVPRVNSYFLGEKIRTNYVAHIGVAVALDDGLITPIVRNCESKTLGQIAREVKELAQRARDRKLKPDEYTGSTFTVSNLGMFDVENFAAIINPPEGAILAVGSILEKPVVENGQIVIGHRMKATLSCDHRVVDGAVGAQFLQELKKILENPASLAV